MANHDIREIPIENLLIDVENPRYDIQSSQREALATIAREQGAKIIKLAEDIVAKGLNPSELPIVTQTDDGNNFIVLEGNRRVAALKLVSSLQLVDSLGISAARVKRLKTLHDDAQGGLPGKVICTVLTRQDARHWILLKHTGENDGVGVVSWDGRASQRFRGTSPALRAIELVEKNGYLDEATKKKLPKIAITNIERILDTPDARKLLGVEVKNRNLEFSLPEKEALGRLSIVVTDIAHKSIKVSDIDRKDQIVDYARRVAAQPLPRPVGSSITAGGPGDAGGLKGRPAPGPISIRRINPDRKSLIPRHFKLSIQQSRINRIYHELQSLDVNQYINCCSVMFRVFIELSIDDYAKRKGLSLVKTIPLSSKSPKPSAPLIQTKKEKTLKEKLLMVSDWMENQGLSSKSELKGIKTMISNRHHILSVESLNAYIHNKDYSPAPADLKANWDSIETFVKQIWTT